MEQYNNSFEFSIFVSSFVLSNIYPFQFIYSLLHTIYPKTIYYLLQHKGIITEPGETNTSSQQFFSTNTLFLNNVGLGIENQVFLFNYTNISSSTLRHTAPQISFPKANRFHTQSQFQLPTKLELPSQLGKRYTQQGFGNKKVFQYEWQKVNAKEFPSPDRYRVRQDPGIDQLKRSFGLSWEAYSKTYLPYNKHQAPEVAKFLPGTFLVNLRSWRIQCIDEINNQVNFIDYENIIFLFSTNLQFTVVLAVKILFILIFQLTIF